MHSFPPVKLCVFIPVTQLKNSPRFVVGAIEIDYLLVAYIKCVAYIQDSQQL